jgi:phosphoribosyl-dephospho-CoA transferase
MGRDAPTPSGSPGSAAGSGLGEARPAGNRAAPHGGRLCRRRTGGAAAATLSWRLAFSFPAAAAMVAVPPVLLCDAARTTPTAWQSVVTAVLDIGDTVKITPRVFGALLWEHATGLPYLTAKSDLDLLWSISDERTAALLVERLLKIEAEGPVRLDGELELPDGAGVNWRELARNSDQHSQVLVKTMDGVEVRNKAGLFRIPVLLS